MSSSYSYLWSKRRDLPLFPVALKTVVGAGVKVNCRFLSSPTADEPPELSKGIIIR